MWVLVSQQQAGVGVKWWTLCCARCPRCWSRRWKLRRSASQSRRGDAPRPTAAGSASRSWTRSPSPAPADAPADAWSPRLRPRVTSSFLLRRRHRRHLQPPAPTSGSPKTLPPPPPWRRPPHTLRRDTNFSGLSKSHYSRLTGPNNTRRLEATL